MSIVTMDMSSYEISQQVNDEAVRLDRSPALALQQQSGTEDSIPPNMVKMDNDAFIKRMHAIEVNATVFLKNMYACQ